MEDDPLEFEPCDGCDTPTANNQLTCCTFTESDGSQDSFNLCPNCRSYDLERRHADE
jgi:hypothetical protein